MPKILVAVMLLSACATAAAQGQRPSGMLIVTDYPAPPPTIAEMVAQVPLIIHGRVERKQVQANRDAPPRTAIEIDLIEVLKGTASDNRLTVFAPGGTVRAGGVETSTVHTRMSLVPVKSEVILFLRPTPDNDGYIVAWGPAGVFQVVGNVVDVHPGVRNHPELRDKPSFTPTELLAFLRGIAQK